MEHDLNHARDAQGGFIALQIVCGLSAIFIPPILLINLGSAIWFFGRRLIAGSGVWF